MMTGEIGIIEVIFRSTNLQSNNNATQSILPYIR